MSATLSIKFVEDRSGMVTVALETTEERGTELEIACAEDLGCTLGKWFAKDAESTEEKDPTQ